MKECADRAVKSIIFNPSKFRNELRRLHHTIKKLNHGHNHQKLTDMERYWNMLVGRKAELTLEARIFHAICLAVIFCLSLSVPINFFLDMDDLSFLLMGVVAVTGVLYYLSRVRGLHKLSSAIFQGFVLLALIGNYYLNSGIAGPSYAMFLLSFMVSVVTSPPRQYFIWLPLNVITLVSLITIEFYQRGSIAITYTDKTSQYVDLLFSYGALAAFALLIGGFVSKAYHKQREELMAQSAALEQAHHTKDKLLSILGHDLKEPLASLQGYLELLADFDLEEEERREMNQQLLTMTKNTSLMLSNILAWTRSHGHSFQVDRRSLLVQDSLQQVVELARSISTSKQVTLWVDIPEGASVEADPDMLALVVRNLLMNAIKFTPRGGNVWLSADAGEGHCNITVRDDGIGIPTALRKQLFSIESGSRRGTASEKGTGLGLMLCKEFTTLMEGKISFVSTKDGGSTFFLKLPPAQHQVLRPDTEAQADNQLLHSN